MIFDTHVHVGQFYNTYFSPQMILNTCRQIGIHGIAVSSTTTCEENYDKVLNEMHELLAQDEIYVAPILWVMPDMFESQAITKMLNSGIPWKCIKIHNYQQQGRWGQSTGEKMKQVVDVAGQLQLPILIHTGNEFCYPNDYVPLIEKYPNQLFILAHSRPVDQTINIMRTHSNVWADTAFTPVGDILQMVDAGLIDRLLWGTDMPQMGYFEATLKGKDALKFDYCQFYHSLLGQLKGILSKQSFQQLTHTNPYAFYFSHSVVPCG